MSEIADVLMGMRGLIKAEPDKFQVYQDYFDLCRLLGKTEKAESYRHNIWLRNITADMARKENVPAQFMKFYELNKKTYLYMAQDDFDSYCVYLEWNRDAEKEVLFTRRKVLMPLVRDLQDLADGKLDFLGISLPTRVGKLLADDTPVLTRNGWKNHGDLEVGDEVISPGGAFKKITHVFPKDYADVRVHFTDGTYADVHENHEWVVF